MTRRPEVWNIILAGFWNRSIFLPDWVLPRLFPRNAIPGGEVQTEVALLQALPLIYRDQEVAVEVSNGLLAFRPLILNDANLLRCERMARAMLEGLPETPVHGVGINFGFRENLPLDHVGALFRVLDDAELAQQGWITGERKLTRVLSRDGETLNLTLTFGGPVIDFDFNFHTQAGASSNPVARRAVEEGRILRLRDAALAMLRETYHLEIEDEDAGIGD
jgi:hypothetical protein